MFHKAVTADVRRLYPFGPRTGGKDGASLRRLLRHDSNQGGRFQVILRSLPTSARRRGSGRFVLRRENIARQFQDAGIAGTARDLLDRRKPGSGRLSSTALG